MAAKRRQSFDPKSFLASASRMIRATRYGRGWCNGRRTGHGRACAHLDGCDDGLVTVAPLLDRLGSVTALIDTEPEAEALARLRAAETIGRPLGSDKFVTRREGIVQRRLRRQQSGRKAKTQADTGDLFAGVDEGATRRGNM